MTAIPWKLFSSICDPTSIQNKDGSTGCAVGMLFLPRSEPQLAEHIDVVKEVLSRSGLSLLGFRDVPVDVNVLGSLSKQFVPFIRQVVVRGGSGGPDSGFESSADLERRLYDCRREILGRFRQFDFDFTNAYVCSLSSKTIIYKGMLRSEDLSRFYKDLVDADFESPFAIYHRRFSTNTVPKWFLAQPMRLLAHNGEINTLLGNINWMKSREMVAAARTKKLTGEALKVRGPLVDVTRSDSANLDSVLESLVRAGRTPEEAIMILVPEAYSSQPRMSAEVREFYRYHESLQEAWDGPALLVFSDGNVVGAALDRNGLRPARFMVTADAEGQETVHVMSEVGVTKILSQFEETGATPSGSVLVEAGRLGPGEILAVDLNSGKLSLNDEVKKTVSQRRPYGTWADQSIRELRQMPFESEISRFQQRFGSSAELPEETGPVTDAPDSPDLLEAQTVFGWGTEDVEQQIASMAGQAIESTFCMGDDAPLAVLSSQPHTLYDYFKQRFAQVTNPPIDSLREGAVMSLAMFLGARGDPLSNSGQLLDRVRIESPVMNWAELGALKAQKGVSFHSLSTVYPLNTALSVGGLESKLKELCDSAIAAVGAGANIIELSDLVEEGGYSSKAFIPPLLAVAAVHHKLIGAGLRNSVSILVTTGQAWSTHHLACLVGFGASAVLPYAAYDSVLNWHAQKRTQIAIKKGELPALSASKALYNYRKAMDKGLLKVLSKMGISLLTSYHGSQIFEALGLSDEVLKTVFPGTPSRVGGMTLDDIAAETAIFHRKAYGDSLFNSIAEKVEGDEDGRISKLFNYGFLNYFKSGDYHHNNQPLIKTLHSAIRTNNLDLYNLYEQDVKSRPPTTLRDTLEFVPAKDRGRSPIPLDQVEPAEKILQRFCTGAMSLGALGREAHETLAIAMNRIGGKSNCGEGGEDPMRATPFSDVSEDGLSATFPHLKGLKNGDSARSKVKQVASGRFGVTPAYLMSGDQLEIKIAQGAKPGEGGQLPGAKIDSYIAGLRNSKPGVTLISPPPHHDIYSIEDLAQLIHDLHQINPKAPVSVKLVSEVGIGTVASGVAKAGADIIQISGHDGGTGASPTSSIKHAGSPWELGLVEAHSTLRTNGLRDRVLLRVDGGLKSGWDVVMAAALGGEEFGFGTIAMIAEGCIMARICHTNKCPVGVTTQNEALRKKFPGVAADVVKFFGFVAEEVRHVLAELGFSSLSEVIGRPGLLRDRTDLVLKKTKKVDISYVMRSLVCQPNKDENLCAVDEDRTWLNHHPVNSNGYTLDDKLLEDTEVFAAIDSHGAISKKLHILNTDRSSFARVSGVIAAKYGDKGFKGELNFAVTGAAGQSFCAFLGQGMHVSLSGYANDYVGKGMAGGSVTVSPPSADDKSSRAGAAKYSVVGNTCLYGATGGLFNVRGKAGERFAVRNSGATGVAEGLGDHGCEYMTAGVVVCLGTTGRNFGAGMTGGLAFVIDDEAWLDGVDKKDLPFDQLVNKETFTLKRLSPRNKAAKAYLEATLERHFQLTGSARASKILTALPDIISKFWAVVPASEQSNPLLVEEQQTVDAMSSV